MQTVYSLTLLPSCNEVYNPVSAPVKQLEWLPMQLRQRFSAPPQPETIVAFIEQLDESDRRSLFLHQYEDGANLLYCLFAKQNPGYGPVFTLTTEDAKRIIEVMGADLICECLSQGWKADGASLFPTLCYFAKSYEQLLLLLEQIPATHEIVIPTNNSGQTALQWLIDRQFSNGRHSPKSNDECNALEAQNRCVECLRQKQFQTLHVPSDKGNAPSLNMPSFEASCHRL